MARKTEPADTVTRWRREAERLRPLEDAHLTLQMEGVTVYLGTLGAVWHAAHHDIRRGGDRELRPLENGSAAGSYQSEEEAAIGSRRPIMEGTPPRYSPAAMGLLKAEERHLKQRERMLMSKLSSILYPEDAKDAA